MHASTDGCIALPACGAVCAYSQGQARRRVTFGHSASLASRPMALPLLLHSIFRSSVTWMHAPPHLLLRQLTDFFKRVLPACVGTRKQR